MADAPSDPWREPTASLPLRWGGYRTRLLGGLLLVVGGGVAVVGGSPVVNWLLAAGTVAHIAGWAVLPSVGWRRVVAMWPSTMVMWALLGGPSLLDLLVVPYLGWLLVRHRPIAAYLTTIIVFAGALFIARLSPSYASMLPALGGEIALLAVAAWVARAVHAAQARLRRGRKAGQAPGASP